MKILFLSHYFPPEVNAPASRTFEHCREWARAGHEVTVVTCAPNHPRGRVYEGYRNELWREEQREGVRVVRLWTWLAANEGFALRTLNYLSFMFACIVATPKLPKADVVVTTSPQFFNGLAGYFVGKLLRIPWVLEIRDLWPESILAVGAIRNRTIIRLLEGLESFAYRKAQHIVAVTDAFKRYMVGKGVAPAKVEVIKNGVNLSFYDRTDGSQVRSELGLDDKFVAAYFGTHGMAHKLEVVLECAGQLQDRTDIAFLLVGDGAERDRLEALKRERNLQNVLMLPQQPKERMPALWAATDVSLVVLQKSELFKTVIPSKIVESFAMQCPVLLGVAGESRELVEAAKAGVAFEPENSAALAAIVAELAQLPEKCREMGRSGRAYVCEHFDRSVLARRYLTVLEQVAAARERSSASNRVGDLAPDNRE